MDIPEGLTLTEIFRFSLQEQLNMAGTRKERRFIMKNNLKELKKAFKSLSKEDKQKFIDETLTYANNASR